MKPHRGRQPQFTTMNVIEGQANLKKEIQSDFFIA